MKIAVIGAGGWGTTLANLLAEKGYKVILWAREINVVNEINDMHENKKFLHGVKLSANLTANNSLSEVLDNAELVVMAVPSKFYRGVAKEVAKYAKKEAIFVSVAKGIEPDTNKTMSQILEEELPKEIDAKIAALSGPNHAEEVSRRMPTATVIASKNPKILQKVKEIFSTGYFKVYPHSDIIGIEICGAIKNITAIAAGMVDGLGYGDNAKGSIITLGLTEMNRFGRCVGAKRSTFYGLAGVGDLIATCTSKHSRNRLVGEKIASGKNLDEIREEMNGMVAEGVFTTKAVYDFSKKHNLNMPLTTQVYKVLYEEKDLKKAASDLINLI